MAFSYTDPHNGFCRLVSKPVPETSELFFLFFFFFHSLEINSTTAAMDGAPIEQEDLSAVIFAAGANNIRGRYISKLQSPPPTSRGRVPQLQELRSPLRSY